MEMAIEGLGLDRSEREIVFCHGRERAWRKEEQR